MAMDAHDIERLIKEGIPDAKVTIRDLAGDGGAGQRAADDITAAAVQPAT